jgi:integrase
VRTTPFSNSIEKGGDEESLHFGTRENSHGLFIHGCSLSLSSTKYVTTIDEPGSISINNTYSSKINTTTFIGGPTMPIVKLDTEFIQKQLLSLKGKRTEYCSVELPGFLVEVRSSSPGQGTYYVRYKDAAAKTRYVKIGRTTEISLNAAIKKAKAVKAEIALGADPRQELTARKAMPTFASFFIDMYMPYVEPRKRTAAKDLEYFRLRLDKAFGHLKLNQITRHQVQLFQNSLLQDEKLAPATCNHYVKLLKHALNLAVDWEILEKNPLGRIPLLDESDNKLERYLDDEELKRFVDVLHNDANRNVCNILLLALNTGCRIGELLSLLKSDVDLPNNIIRIRSCNSKSKRSRVVPLSSGALTILRQQMQLTPEFAPVFVSPTGKNYTTTSKVFGRLRNKANLPNLRIHDLRHNFASALVNDGRTLLEVGQILGHLDLKSTKRYSHLNSKTLEEAANCASDRINNVMEKVP